MGEKLPTGVGLFYWALGPLMLSATRGMGLHDAWPIGGTATRLAEVERAFRGIAVLVNWEGAVFGCRVHCYWIGGNGCIEYS